MRMSYKYYVLYTILSPPPPGFCTYIVIGSTFPDSRLNLGRHHVTEISCRQAVKSSQLSNGMNMITNYATALLRMPNETASMAAAEEVSREFRTVQPHQKCVAHEEL